MGLRRKNSVTQLVMEEDTVDLAKASYALSLSSTGLEEKSQTFHVTLDKVIFKKPVDIITTVLDANGYSLNLENMLACFDELKLGVKAQLSGKAHGAALPVVKEFLPCLQFQLPTMGKIGPILKRFYQEVKAYESQIERLEQGTQTKRSAKEKSPEQLQKEIDKLKSENSKLKAQVNELSARLALAAKSEANANKALEAQNIMPPNLRIATVREVNLQDRNLVLRSARSTYHLPMATVEHLPLQGDRCLLHIRDAKAISAFFFESQGRKFDIDLAKVLFVGPELCKLRDSHRQIHIFHAKNSRETAILSSLKRHSKVLIYSIDQCLIKIEKVEKLPAYKFLRKIQEQIALSQIREQASDHNKLLLDESLQEEA